MTDLYPTCPCCGQETHPEPVSQRQAVLDRLLAAHPLHAAAYQRRNILDFLASTHKAWVHIHELGANLIGDPHVQPSRSASILLHNSIKWLNSLAGSPLRIEEHPHYRGFYRLIGSRRAALLGRTRVSTSPQRDHQNAVQ